MTDNVTDKILNLLYLTQAHNFLMCLKYGTIFFQMKQTIIREGTLCCVFACIWYFTVTNCANSFDVGGWVESITLN